MNIIIIITAVTLNRGISTISNVIQFKVANLETLSNEQKSDCVKFFFGTNSAKQKL